MAGVLTWLTIAILGWTDNYRLSLAGIAGLIVAIGLTADSFIVYFERIKDELRAGHTVPVAVHEGWKRARRTITASKAVNLLAAVVLYFVAVGNVRGFAFTLGLTAIADLIVVFMFTHPLMVLLAQTRFVGEGHPMSGLDPSLLGGPSLYQGAGRFREPAHAPRTGLPAEDSDEPADAAAADDAAATDAPRPLVATGAPRAGSSARGGGRRSRTAPPMTIAERRRAERRRQEEDQ